jgi:hypothetical protein
MLAIDNSRTPTPFRKFPLRQLLVAAAERRGDCSIKRRSQRYRYGPCQRSIQAAVHSRERYEVLMAYKETFWMACDSTEQLRAEYGPFHTRAEAEIEAQKLGFGFLLRYEHMIGDGDEIKEVRCVFIELDSSMPPLRAIRRLHTRCATCGETAVHDESWRAEVWADIHEFEHSRHRVRLFEQTRSEGLKEIGNWRDACA